MVSAVVRVQTGQQDDKFVVTLPQWGRNRQGKRTQRSKPDEYDA